MTLPKLTRCTTRRMLIARNVELDFLRPIPLPDRKLRRMVFRIGKTHIAVCKVDSCKGQLSSSGCRRFPFQLPADGEQFRDVRILWDARGFHASTTFAMTTPRGLNSRINVSTEFTVPGM